MTTDFTFSFLFVCVVQIFYNKYVFHKQMSEKLSSTGNKTKDDYMSFQCHTGTLFNRPTRGIL